MKKVIFITISVFLTTSFVVSNKIEALIQKEITTALNIEKYTKQTVQVSNEINKTLPIKITETNFFKIKSNNEVIGYYYYGQAFGKAANFDFIVIFDDELIVSKVKILVYREDHGGEVGSRRWLNQFIGKSTDKNLEYQKDIAAISGATISAKSITNEINKVFKTIEILNQKKQL